MPDRPAHIRDLIDDFSLFDDWEERYAYLIDLGKNLPVMEEGLKTSDTLVPGCTSRVWMVIAPQDGVMHFQADSDAHIVRGLIGVLMRIYNGQPVTCIRDIPIKEVFRELGLETHLSPNRRSGFFSMVERLYSSGVAAA